MPYLSQWLFYFHDLDNAEGQYIIQDGNTVVRVMGQLGFGHMKVMALKFGPDFRIFDFRAY